MKEQTYCRWAPSLGELEGPHQKVWGTETYHESMQNDFKPTVFFGLYGMNDFYALWRHKGHKWILWAGSDIRHFENGYWLDEKGEIRIDNKGLSQWINANCESWVENTVEQEALRKCGIESQVCPSFLGDVTEYEQSYQWSDKPKVYASVSGDDFYLYRWDNIEQIAKLNPRIEFHLYGNKGKWESKQKNVIVHGRVPKEQMNNEIKHMQGGLRLLKFDGFSEVLAKSVLWGQWPISAIPYPHMLGVDELERLHAKHHANTEGREHYRKSLNNYPWNMHI